MGRKVKRFLVSMLVVVIFFSSVPISALAEEAVEQVSISSDENEAIQDDAEVTTLDEVINNEDNVDNVDNVEAITSDNTETSEDAKPSDEVITDENSNTESTDITSDDVKADETNEADEANEETPSMDDENISDDPADEVKTCKVFYNTKYGTIKNNTFYVEEGTVINLAGFSSIPSSEFLGYLIDGQMYNINDPYTVTKDTEIVAVFAEPKLRTITFNFMLLEETNIADVTVYADYYDNHLCFEHVLTNNVIQVPNQYKIKIVASKVDDDPSLKKKFKCDSPYKEAYSNEFYVGTYDSFVNIIEYLSPEDAIFNYTYVVRYYENENSSNYIPKVAHTIETYVVEDYPYALPDNMKFLHWVCNENTYNAGDEISAFNMMYFYPVFEEYVKVSFDANDGTGSMSDIELKKDSSYTLPSCSFTKEGYRFKSWEVNGESKNINDEIIVSENTVVKAIWEELPKYTVSFNPNGGTGTMDSELVMEGNKYKLPTCSFAKEHFTFSSWNVNDESYKVGDEIVITNDTEVKAMWDEDPKFTLSFDANGGKGTMESVVYYTGTIVELPSCTYTRSGYKFDCWNVDGLKCTSVTINSDVVAKATWKKIETIVNPPSDNAHSDEIVSNDTNTDIIANVSVDSNVSNETLTADPVLVLPAPGTLKTSEINNNSEVSATKSLNATAEGNSEIEESKEETSNETIEEAVETILDKPKKIEDDTTSTTESQNNNEVKEEKSKFPLVVSIAVVSIVGIGGIYLTLKKYFFNK